MNTIYVTQHELDIIVSGLADRVLTVHPIVGNVERTALITLISAGVREGIRLAERTKIVLKDEDRKEPNTHV